MFLGPAQRSFFHDHSNFRVDELLFDDTYRQDAVLTAHNKILAGSFIASMGDSLFVLFFQATGLGFPRSIYTTIKPARGKAKPRYFN